MINGQPQYYPPYQQYQQPVMMQQPTVQNQILTWVQSEDEAVKFPLSAGQSIFMMNQNEDYLYMKCVDQLGKPTFIKKRLIDETEHHDNQVDLSDYIRKEELETMITAMIKQEVERKVSEVSFKATKTRRKSSEA